MKFPQYLHRPYQLLWWEADEMMIFIMLLTLTFMYGSFRGVGILLWVAPFVGLWGYGKFKKKYPRGFINHISYFIGFTDFKHYPDYFIDKFRE